MLERARALARLSRAPGHHVARHRTRLHQQLRELRAATRRAIATANARRARPRRRPGPQGQPRRPFAVERASRRAHADAATLDRTAAAALERRRRDLDRILRAPSRPTTPTHAGTRLRARSRTRAGEPITSAAAAREQPSLTIRLHDGRVQARPERPKTRAKRGPMSVAAEDDGPRLF